jgi:diacylglycerol kinase family enzyme
LPNDPIEATSVLLDALSRGSIRKVGLGSVNGRYFLFHVGVGFDAAVVAQVEQRTMLKRYAGHLLFVYFAFTTWFRHYDRTRPRFAVRHEDGSVVDDGYYTICLNTNPYTFFGNRPLNIAPDAGLDRPLVTITVRTMRFTGVLRVVGLALAGAGRVRRHRKVDYRTDETRLVISGYGPFPYQVDGEALGDVERLELRHEPDVLRLVMP